MARPAAAAVQMYVNSWRERKKNSIQLSLNFSITKSAAVMLVSEHIGESIYAAAERR